MSLFLPVVLVVRMYYSRGGKNTAKDCLRKQKQKQLL